MDKKYKRLLILIVAYQAEKTLQQVLLRIPKSVLEYNYKILVIDDSSTDTTFEQGLAFKKSNPHLNIEIMYNAEKQGYGGNQKIGYQYAIKNNFDLVALLHGEGKYAPEVIENLIQPIVRGEADAVIGNRYTGLSYFFKKGIPLYKSLGNTILTFIQNKLLKSGFSDFHSGYRAYAVSALKKLPFEYNTNDFHFDTEILIQFQFKKLKIAEVPIPPYSSKEIQLNSGIFYALKALRSTLVAFLQDFNIYYRRNFDVSTDNHIYDLKLGYTSSHTMALDTVSKNANVLDIGCGQMTLADHLVKMGCTYHGIDKYEIQNEKHIEWFSQLDLNNDMLDFKSHYYDHILLLDVLEHFTSPERILDTIREKVGEKKPTIVISIPNTAFILVRIRLAMGEIQYGKQGIMDITHYRLFTERSMLRMLSECGYKVSIIKGIPAPFPKALGHNFLGFLLLKINEYLIRLSRKLFAYQIFIIAKPLPTLSDLLSKSYSSSLERIKVLEDKNEAQKHTN